MSTMTPESIKAIMVTLDADQGRALFIVLTDDQSVNRLGTGAVNNDENDLFIGKTDDPLFLQLRAMVRPEWLQHFGRYDIPSKVGSICKLTLLFKFAAEEGGIEFSYGSDSQGPPGDIVHFVTEAVRLTDPWYARQKSLVANRKQSKPWWRFW